MTRNELIKEYESFMKNNSNNSKLIGENQAYKQLLDNLGYGLEWCNSGEWTTAEFKANAYLKIKE